MLGSQLSTQEQLSAILQYIADTLAGECAISTCATRILPSKPRRLECCQACCRSKSSWTLAGWHESHAVIQSNSTKFPAASPCPRLWETTFGFSIAQCFPTDDDCRKQSTEALDMLTMIDCLQAMMGKCEPITVDDQMVCQSAVTDRIVSVWEPSTTTGAGGVEVMDACAGYMWELVLR